MTTYPGLPVPEIRPHLTREASTAHYAPGVTFAIDVITLCGNTGTYVDSPFHRLADGQDLGELPLERLVDVPAVRVDVTGSASRAVDARALLPYDLAGRAVLVHTGHDRHWGTEAYGRDNPFLTAAAVDLLVEAGAAIVGIDSLNIDDPADLDAAGALRAARSRHPDLRAPDEPRHGPCRGCLVQRDPGPGPCIRHVPGPRGGIHPRAALTRVTNSLELRRIPAAEGWRGARFASRERPRASPSTR